MCGINDKNKYMKNLITSVRSTLLMILATAALSSCVKDIGTGDSVASGSGGQRTIAFSVSVPGSANPASRALSPANEEEVEEITVLVFNAATDRLVIASRNHSTAPVQVGSTVTFTVTVPVGGPFKLMVLANAQDILDEAYPAGLREGTALAGIQAALVMDKLGSGKSDQASHKWSTTVSQGKYYIPMWGAKYVQEITEDENQKIEGIYLHRMVAKVDVSIKRTDQESNPVVPVSIFEMTGVYVMNYNTKGRLIPELTPAYGDWMAADPADAYAKLPTEVSAQIFVNTQQYYQEFTQSSFTDAAKNSAMAGEIYLFEADKGENSYLTRPCLIIKGKYKGGAETYYRVDMIKAGTAEYLHILRNFKYNVSVISVSGPGYGDLETAYKSRPVDMEAEILEWNDSELGNIVFDGQNMLAVSKGLFEFSMEKRTAASDDNYLTITTDVKAIGSILAGWQAKVYNDQDGMDLLSDGTVNGWLRLTQYSGDGNYPVGNQIQLLADENGTGNERIAYIRITAGRLTYIVTVIQGIQAELMLEVTDLLGNPVTELDFPLVSPTAKNFVLNWAPSAISVRVIVNQSSDPFNISSISPVLGSLVSGNGKETYSVNPGGAGYSGSDLFYEKSATVIFEIPSEHGTLSRTLLLRQADFNLIPDVSPIFIMDGTTEYRVQVESNFPWKVELAAGGDPEGVLSQFSTQYGGRSSHNEDFFSFKLIDNVTDVDASKLQADVNVVFYQLIDGVWVPWQDHGPSHKEYTLKCYAARSLGQSNAYMVGNDGIPVMIPVSQMYRAMVDNSGNSPAGYLGAGWVQNYDNLKAAVLWSDISTLTGENAVVNYIMQYRKTGNLAGDGIIIMPGNGQGNAGVIIYEDNNGNGTYDSGDVIRWSWHIWKSDYYPYSDYPAPLASGIDNKWMDRNLGAMTNAANINARGLHYQWGRKDPFPSVTSFTPSGANDYFYYTTSTKFVQTTTPNASNLSNSVSNPLTRYYHGASYDWYSTSNTGYNDYLWGHPYTPSPAPDYVSSTGKSVYDPCPEGYRVPRYGQMADSSTGWSSYANNGRSNSNYGGYYPDIKYRYSSGTSWGNTTLYWLASAAAYNSSGNYAAAYNMSFTNSTFTASSSYQRAASGSIRCVAE